MSILDLLKILNTAIDAGKEIQKVYKKSFNVEIKDDNSPITEADIKSNNLILNRLKSFNPNVPILSEESLIEWKERNFINPPYSRKLKEAFVLKAIEESKKGKLCVMLLPVSTSTKLFHHHILPNQKEIRFVYKRIKFKGCSWLTTGVDR